MSNYDDKDDTSGTSYGTTGNTYDTADNIYNTTGYGTTYDYGTPGYRYGDTYGTAASSRYGNVYDDDTYGERLTYDTGYGSTVNGPATGAYDQHMDYRTDGSQRHHRERVSPSGTYRHRDVDRRDDGTTRVHREYDNPNTGTTYHRNFER